MGLILNIETSGKICSVAISRDGVCVYKLDDKRGMKHAEVLAPFVEECMSWVKSENESLDAVAVSLGPGSYTGLRIGLSMAKGVAFGLDIPLIGIDTLKLLASIGQFRIPGYTTEELFIPMVDARRMEVFQGVYDYRMEPVGDVGPKILDSNSYKEYLETRRVCFVGDGAGKAMEVISSPNAVWMPDILPMAEDMIPFSEMAWRRQQFIDKAYSVPNYLKEYQTTIAKPKV
ncbi:MAG: tRNA (adenosine(37)-N6)-threonylcarbamoyltransferase complex dimerization subunit type 1 TsaB [Muribaculaceae bacterium]|nr:tRNA (adenosine(37)-N6)-threonylcarbamoyltransferase complex dimerization subunit type 1 TsaB [Muribaculaceae bacterium]